MKNTTFIAGIVAAGFGLAATTAMAFGPGSGGQGPRMNFQELDSDGDGQITQSEMEGRMDARFNEADTDGDGLLSAAEMETQGQKKVADRVARMIERFDKDGDGSLSQDEMPAPRKPGRMFGYFDQDNSGGISEQEFKEAREEMRDHKKGHWGKHRNKN